MMKSSLFVAPFLALVLATQVAVDVPTAQAAPQQSSAALTTIVAGKSVGRVNLGDTRVIVRRKLGVPSKTYTRKDGYAVDQWIGPQQIIDREMGAEHTVLTVLYARGKAAQIEFNSPKFVTNSKLSTKSKLRDFYRLYPRLHRTSYVYKSEDREASHEYFDARSAGLCAEITAQDMALTFQLQTLIVHAPNKRVIPQAGGENTTSLTHFSAG